MEYKRKNKKSRSRRVKHRNKNDIIWPLLVLSFYLHLLAQILFFILGGLEALL